MSGHQVLGPLDQVADAALPAATAAASAGTRTQPNLILSNAACAVLDPAVRRCRLAAANPSNNHSRCVAMSFGLRGASRSAA